MKLQGGLLGLVRELDADISCEAPPGHAGAYRALLLSSGRRVAAPGTCSWPHVPGPPAAPGHTEGDASAIGAYWMDVYDGEGNVVIRSYCASPPGGYAPPGSLAEYADDQLIGELERRLRGR